MATNTFFLCLLRSFLKYRIATYLRQVFWIKIALFICFCWFIYLYLLTKIWLSNKSFKQLSKLYFSFMLAYTHSCFMSCYEYNLVLTISKLIKYYFSTYVVVLSHPKKGRRSSSNQLKISESCSALRDYLHKISKGVSMDNKHWKCFTSVP